MDLTEEQQMMKETVRRFALEQVEPLAVEIDRDHRFPEETAAMMAELGLLGICIPASRARTSTASMKDMFCVSRRKLSASPLA